MRRVVFVSIAAAVLPALLSAQQGGSGNSATGAGRGAARDPMQEQLQLKPTRTVTFTTNVGHWTSVDISPDGQMLVFDLLGDLYTMPVAGGKATSRSSMRSRYRIPTATVTRLSEATSSVVTATGVMV